MYDYDHWPEYEQEFESEPLENGDGGFEFEARWRGSGEFELVYSREAAIPLHRLPDFTLPVGIAAVIFVLFVLTRSGSQPAIVGPVIEAAAAGLAVVDGPAAAPAASITGPTIALAPPPDPDAFAAPYEDYVLTQGVHGASYGHMAIDLAAGRGATILSPINGVVRDHYTDRYGNPTLVIENERYIVTMLHGIYSVEAGDVVAIGEPVGEESNLGYTTDMRGVPCWQKTGPCGNHTHLNVYDKTLESNVNPLDLIRP